MKFQVPGTPKAWKRPRKAYYGGFYDSQTKDKDTIGYLALQAKAKVKSDQMKGDLMAIMSFYKSERRRKDLDNMIKLVMDALNNILYNDDSQIVKIIASKVQCEAGYERTEIEIFPIQA